LPLEPSIAECSRHNRAVTGRGVGARTQKHGHLAGPADDRSKAIEPTVDWPTPVGIGEVGAKDCHGRVAFLRIPQFDEPFVSDPGGTQQGNDPGITRLKVPRSRSVRSFDLGIRGARAVSGVNQPCHASPPQCRDEPLRTGRHGPNTIANGPKNQFESPPEKPTARFVTTRNNARNRRIFGVCDGHEPEYKSYEVRSRIVPRIHRKRQAPMDMLGARPLASRSVVGLVSNVPSPELIDLARWNRAPRAIARAARVRFLPDS
jgi:hypothetical protein